MAANNSPISQYLTKILSAVYGKDVRKAIHDAISECYDDVNEPSLNTSAFRTAVQEKIDDGSIAGLSIGEGTITPAHTSFMDYSDDLLNYYGITFDNGGHYLNHNTGGFVNSANDEVTADFVPVQENTEYYGNNETGSAVASTRQVVFYDDEYNFISGIRCERSQFVFTTPAGCAYIKFDIQKAYRDVEYLKSNFDAHYRITIPDMSVAAEQLYTPVQTENIADGAVTQKKTDFLVFRSMNLLRGVSYTKDYYLNNAGVPTAAKGYDAYTDFIPIKGNTFYALSPKSRNRYVSGHLFNFYDENKTHLVCMSLPLGKTSFKSPEGAAYLRYNLWLGDMGIDFIVEASQEKALYDPWQSEANMLFGIDYTPKCYQNDNNVITSNNNNNDAVSDYIPVTGGATYVRERSSDWVKNKEWISCFDENMNYISTITKVVDNNLPGYTTNELHNGKLNPAFTVPDNCAYIRMTLNLQAGVLRDDVFLTAKENVPLFEGYANAYDYTGIDDLRITPDQILGNIDTGSTSNGLPVLNLLGDMTGMSKDNAIKFRYEFLGKKGWCKVKWQGNSSLSYPKKNFTITFYHDPYYGRKDKVDVGLDTKQSKWVTKANYIDHSQARNIVGARLWSQIVKCRKTAVPDLLATSPRYGAVDGYPITIKLNGAYYGLYTMNIAKDDFTFGMDEDNPLHCAACGETNNNGNNSMTLAEEFRVTSGIGSWSCEVPGTFSTEARTSLANLIQFVRTSTDEDFKAGLNDYLDVESAIDYYLFAYFICAEDSLGKNIILLTYDLQKWYMSMYDMDSTFGLYWNGSYFLEPDTPCPEGYQETNSLLWQRIEANFAQELYDRYTLLRQTVLSIENVCDVIDTFVSQISKSDYTEDVAQWTAIPQGNIDHAVQMKEFITARAEYVDSEFEAFNTPEE